MESKEKKWSLNGEREYRSRKWKEKIRLKYRKIK